MTIKELIEHLQTMPQDALVIHTFCSDYDALKADDFTLMTPTEKGGIINHHGHIMYCKRDWLADADVQHEILYLERWKGIPKPTETPAFITAVHIRGN